MNAKLTAALAEIAHGLEALETALPISGPKARVDLAARVNAIKTRAEALSSVLKGSLWEIGGEEIKGENFLAVLRLVQSDRLDTSALREAHPQIVKKFTISATQQRVTFRPL